MTRPYGRTSLSTVLRTEATAPPKSLGFTSRLAGIVRSTPRSARRPQRGCHPLKHGLRSDQVKRAT